jgi:hypothetical protein
VAFSFFLCLLWTTPHARSIVFLISDVCASCSSTNCRRILSYGTAKKSGEMKMLPQLEKMTEAHFEIPISGEKATCHTLKWIHVCILFVVPEYSSLGRLEVF